ncbi:MAG: hybrid sensor histidine kinase/response regulator, partial [Betaproteobacteria bacterium HGW-Betaproteobacteria-19]
MREMLYQVAHAPATTETQHAVRKTWQLDALLPEPGARVSDVPLAPLLQDLRSRLASIKEQWDAFSTGAAIALPRFESQLDHFAAPVSRLGRPSVDRLIRGIQQFTQWLRKDPLHFSDSISIELATALLLTEAALDRSVPDASFSAQVDDTLSRLEALARGERLAAAENSPGLETARRAQERDALAQLSREILTSLANVEQTLDDFFRDQLKRAPLAQLSTPLRQIEGALSLLGEADAISLIHEVGEAIARFAAQDTPAEQTELEALASRLSALGFFIQSLQHGRTSLQQLLNPDAQARTDESEPALEAAGTMLGDMPTEQTAPGIPDFTAAAPPDEPPAHETEPVTDSGAIHADELALAASEDDISAPTVTAMPEVGAETRRLIEASDEEIDAELLCIFIEEAHEVLATIGEQVELSRTDPANVEYLTAIRRGFHTLKGSGRMVGLRDLGEAAWGLEQTLNRWLQLEWAPTSALHHLIDEAHQHFSAWVVQLESGGSHQRDVTDLLAEASRLCDSDSPARESAVGTRADAPEAASGSASVVAIAETDFIETTLEFPDLALSESGEVLPFMTEAEASTFLPEETSLEEFPIFGEDLSFELTDTEAIDVGATAPRHGITQETAEPRIAVEPDAQAESETIDLEPLLGPIDLDLSDDESYEAFAPPPAAPVDTEQAPELLNITALDDAWLPVEETFELVDEEIAADETIEAIEAAIEGMEASIDEVDAIEEAAEETEELEASELARDEPAEALPAENIADARDASILHETPSSASPLDTGDESALNDFETAALAEDIEALELPDAEETVEVEEVEETLETSEATEVPEVEDAPALVEAIESSGTDFIRVGDAEISRPLYDLYLAEAKHHIATLQQDFSRLAANPTLPPPETALRAAHTFGGISGTARIASLQMLARALEHAEQRLRDQGAPPSADDLNLFRTVVIALEGMLAEVVVQRMPLDAPELIAQLEHVGRRASEPIQAAEHTAPAVHVPAAAAEAAEEQPVLRVHDEIDDQLLPIFLEEAGELLSDLHTTLRNWQADPRDADHAKGVARLLHTLKGSARMAGAMTLGEQVHQLESRLELATGSGHDLSAEIEDLVVGLDLTEQMIDALAGGELPAAAVPAEGASAPHEGSPTSGTAVTIDAAGAEGDAATGSGTLRVRAELVDRFVNEAGEIGVARTRIDGELRNLRRSMLDLTENVIRLRSQLREVEIQADVQMQSRIAQAESHHAEFDPLEMDRYTRLQELTRMMAESVNDVTTVQQSLLKNLDGADLALHSQARMSRELQQALMRVRMVPFDSLADRLYRIVRKSGKELGKRAN